MTNGLSRYDDAAQTIYRIYNAKHAALRRKSKDWLARNQNNVSEWSIMSSCGLLFEPLALLDQTRGESKHNF
jgi:hypothetical protein